MIEGSILGSKDGSGPEPGGPKTYESYGFGSTALLKTFHSTQAQANKYSAKIFMKL